MREKLKKITYSSFQLSYLCLYWQMQQQLYSLNQKPRLLCR